ncbi:hypothetical protein ABW21_db0208053 [Orbilia brochopaga]|nr:hypothetical protein ABW21_db0208053 [Drechslerella brochopaga]
MLRAAVQRRYRQPDIAKLQVAAVRECLEHDIELVDAAMVVMPRERGRVGQKDRVSRNPGHPLHRLAVPQQEDQGRQVGLKPLDPRDRFPALLLNVKDVQGKQTREHADGHPGRGCLERADGAPMGLAARDAAVLRRDLRRLAADATHDAEEGRGDGGEVMQSLHVDGGFMLAVLVERGRDGPVDYLGDKLVGQEGNLLLRQRVRKDGHVLVRRRASRFRCRSRGMATITVRYIGSACNCRRRGRRGGGS